MYLDRAAALSGLHVLSALRSYKLDQFLEESVSVALHLSGCRSALGRTTMVLENALDLNRLALASHWYQALFAPSLFHAFTRSTASQLCSPPSCALGIGSFVGSAPELPGWQWVLMQWWSDLKHGLLLVTSELSCYCGIWEETFRIALGWRTQKHQAEEAAAWRWLDLPKGFCNMQGVRAVSQPVAGTILPLKCIDRMIQCLYHGHLLYCEQDGGAGGIEKIGHSWGMMCTETAKRTTTCLEPPGPRQGCGAACRGKDQAWAEGLDHSVF